MSAWLKVDPFEGSDLCEELVLLGGISLRVAAFTDQPCINVVSSGLEPYGADMQV